METIRGVCLNDGAFAGRGTGATHVMGWKRVSWELLAGIRKSSTFRTELFVLHGWILLIKDGKTASLTTSGRRRRERERESWE